MSDAAQLMGSNNVSMTARTMRNTARRVTVHMIAMHLFQMPVTFKLIQLKKTKKKQDVFVYQPSRSETQS